MPEATTAEGLLFRAAPPLRVFDLLRGDRSGQRDTAQVSPLM